MTKQYMKNIVLEREALTPDQFQHVTDDARTSQSGYVYRYCPEEGREKDWRLLYDILLYFLRFYKKQKGTKWKYVQKELTLE